MIIGGSRIAVYLAMALLDEGVKMKLIEIQKERSRQLAELLPKATVIFADGSDRSILDSEGIDQTDAVVTLTDIDEENLIVSMYANYLKVPKVITKINRTEYTCGFFGIRELIVWSALRNCVPDESSCWLLAAGRCWLLSSLVSSWCCCSSCWWRRRLLLLTSFIVVVVRLLLVLILSCSIISSLVNIHKQTFFHFISF